MKRIQKMQRMKRIQDPAHCLGHFWIIIPEMFLKIPEQTVFLQIQYLADLELIPHLLAVRGCDAELQLL